MKLNIKKENITLSKGKSGNEYQIVSLQSCSEELCEKLHGMGLYEGCKIHILQNNKNSPLKIAKDFGRIAIDKTIANKIIVR